MKMEFKNPEILISLFSPEDIVTTSLTGNALDADNTIRTTTGNGATVKTLTADFMNLSFTEMRE